MPSFNGARRLRSVLAFAGLLAVFVPLVAGCDSKSSAEKLRDAGFDPASRAVSFLSIAEHLNNLDQSVKARDEARIPAEVIVDATRSTDGQPVLAGVTDGANKSGVFSILSVPQGNVDFVAHGVAAEDMVEYYIQIPDPARPSETLRLTHRFRVAELIDAHTLRIAPPLRALSAGESYPPFPIVILRQQAYDDSPERALDHWQLTGQPAVGWEMTPDRAALDQLIVQLNQWIERDDTEFAWQVDSLIASLPKDQQAQFADLAAERFANEDARLLQETVWLRDIARRAATAGSELEQARRLFDWTVRNLQLETRQSMLGIRQRPWQALISSRATADERAWVFVLLLRQLGIDAVAITIPATQSDTAKSASDVTSGIWTVAVRAGDNWHLFDPTLGLPIPGPDGRGIATLAQAKADDAILRQLDLAEQAYPVTAEQVRRAVAHVEASPLYLMRRTRRIELQLAGENRMILSASPGRIADAIRPLVTTVGVWSISADTAAAQNNTSLAARAMLVDQYRAFVRISALWKGRVLEFKGDDHRLDLDYADRPVRVYVRQRDPRWYFTRYCRPSDADLAEANPAEYDIASLRLAKQLATVWMGVIALEDQDFAEAVAYFGERTLDLKDRSPLRPLARLNLAQTREQIAELLDKTAARFEDADPMAIALKNSATEQRAAAVALYQADDSAGRHGSLLRAKSLSK